MEALDNIRIKAGRLILKKEVKNNLKRTPIFCNLNTASSVALLMNISDESDMQKITKFEKFLKAEFGIKKVFILGYSDSKKEEPDFLRSSISFDYLQRKDLSWNGIPSGSVYENFVAERFDILIDMTNYFNVPLRFVLLRSKAKFKTGIFSEESKPYFDMMIAFDKGNFEEYANQLVHYLTIINAK